MSGSHDFGSPTLRWFPWRFPTTLIPDGSVIDDRFFVNDLIDSNRSDLPDPLGPVTRMISPDLTERSRPQSVPANPYSDRHSRQLAGVTLYWMHGDVKIGLTRSSSPAYMAKPEGIDRASDYRGTPLSGQLDGVGERPLRLPNPAATPPVQFPDRRDGQGEGKVDDARERSGPRGDRADALG